MNTESKIFLNNILSWLIGDIFSYPYCFLDEKKDIVSSKKQYGYGKNPLLELDLGLSREAQEQHDSPMWPLPFLNLKKLTWYKNHQIIKDTFSLKYDAFITKICNRYTYIIVIKVSCFKENVCIYNSLILV